MKFSREILIAEPNDAHDIIKIQQNTALATYINLERNVTREDIENFNKKLNPALVTVMIESSAYHFWKAVVKKITVGFIFVIVEKEKNVIGGWYVLPEYQKDGIGSDLITKALEFLGNEKDIYADVVTYNAKTISAYEKRGFIREGVYENPDMLLKSGGILPEIWMIKRH